MSKFAENQAISAERRQMLWDKKKEGAKFYRDLAKLSFGGMIVSEFVKFQEEHINWYVLLLGVSVTIMFNYIANRILKLK